jgi:hypothetical protein
MNISRKTLIGLGACKPLRMTFLLHYRYDAEIPWKGVVDDIAWSTVWVEWIKCAVARHGNDEDRKALRCDKSHHVRLAVARYGNDEDREALRGDESNLIRQFIINHEVNQ